MENYDPEKLAESRVLQWKYTSSKYNIEQSTGFFTFSKSESLTNEEKNELVKKVAHYDPLEFLPKRPTQEELNSFPVAFSYFRLSNRKAVLCRTQYIGMDYASSRYGNFFAHALVLQNKKDNWDDPLCYLNSSTFARELTQEEIELGRVPEPLPELALEDVEKKNTPASRIKINRDWLNILKRLVDGFYKALNIGTNLVVYLDDNLLKDYAAPILAWFLKILPEEVRKKVSFCTYVREPSYEPLLNKSEDYCFIAFAPSTAKKLNSAGKFVSVDLSNISTLAGHDYEPICVYARCLSDAFLKNIVAVYRNDVEKASENSPVRDIREKDLLYLNNIGHVGELLQHKLSSVDAVRDVWKYLWSLFLEEKYDVPVKKFVTKVLQNGQIISDYKLVREVLAFSIRVIDGVNRPEDKIFRDRAVSEVCKFWLRHIPREWEKKKEWRTGVFNEVKEVFGSESIAASVCSKGYCSAEEYLKTFLEMPSTEFDDQVLTYALDCWIIIKKPSGHSKELDEKLINRMREFTSSKHELAESNQKPDESMPWEAFFKAFATEINDSEAYAQLCRIIGYEKFKDYINAKEFSKCSEYWKVGKGVPIDEKRRSFDYNETQKENDEQILQLTVVDASKTPQKKRSSSQRKDGSVETKKERGTHNLKTMFPGRDSLIIWLVNHQEDERYFNLLKEKELFGSFYPKSQKDYNTYKDFKHAWSYFKDINGIIGYNGPNWQSLEELWYEDVKDYRNKVLMWRVIGILSLIIVLVTTYFAMRYWSEIKVFVLENWGFFSNWIHGSQPKTR
ncbi:MAG: hypothetical protein IK077_16055 [Thermoguttaceae bacterium]|nr:hypothetical protein [Thermoguttaceae bacterium]